MSLKYDDLEGIMASMMPHLAQIYREEVSIKKAIVDHFKIDIEFEENYDDLKMIIPTKLKDHHPVFTLLGDYDWVMFSEYAEAVIVLNRKATDMTAGPMPTYKGVGYDNN